MKPLRHEHQLTWNSKIMWLSCSSQWQFSSPLVALKGMQQLYYSGLSSPCGSLRNSQGWKQTASIREFHAHIVSFTSVSDMEGTGTQKLNLIGFLPSTFFLFPSGELLRCCDTQHRTTGSRWKPDALTLSINIYVADQHLCVFLL